MRSLFIVLASILCLTLPSDIRADQTKTGRTRVVGGEHAQLEDWPGYAALRVIGSDGKTAKYFCGGTAINPYWILTAAHCLHDYAGTTNGSLRDSVGKPNSTRIQVVLGIADLREVEQAHVFDVEQVALHPSYLAELRRIVTRATAGKALRIALDHGNDIALIRLNRAWKGPLATLSLTDETDPATDTQVRVAGFGYTDITLKTGLKRFQSTQGDRYLFAGSDRLLQAALLTAPTATCLEHFPKANIANTQVCAGLKYGSRDSCSGDSGGPLVAYGENRRPFQFGLVSWGKEQCGAGKSFAVYTRISSHAAWLRSIVPKLQFVEPEEAPVLHSSSLSQHAIYEAVSQLRNSLSNGGKVSIRIRGGSVFRLGQEVVFEAQTEVDGRLLIFDINGARTVSLIYPNKFTLALGDQVIKAGALTTIPSDGYGFTAFEAQEPIGKGTLIALVVPPEFDLSEIGVSEHMRNSMKTKGFAPVKKPTSYFMRLISQIEFSLANHRAADATMRVGGFGMGTFEYEIRK